MLAGDTAGGAVFHQGDIVDVGHFGAAYALVDPAHYVAEDALAVVVQFLPDFRFAPGGIGFHRDGEDVVQRGAGTGFQRFLFREYVDPVVVQGVQHGGGGRGHPSAVGAGVGVVDLGFHHPGHGLGHGPHAFADLGVAGQAAGEADVDVPVFVGADPGLAFHVGLALHGAGFHGGVNLVAGAVQEAGVDEDDPVGGLADAFLEVDGGAAFLVHDADLDGQRLHAQGALHPREQFHGERDFPGAVHLRFDDV